MLKLVPGLRKRARDRVLLVRNHPGEKLNGGGERTDARGKSRQRSQRSGRGVSTATVKRSFGKTVVSGVAPVPCLILGRSPGIAADST